MYLVGLYIYYISKIIQQLSYVRTKGCSKKDTWQQNYQILKFFEFKNHFGNPKIGDMSTIFQLLTVTKLRWIIVQHHQSFFASLSSKLNIPSTINTPKKLLSKDIREDKKNGLVAKVPMKLCRVEHFYIYLSSLLGVIAEYNSNHTQK